MKIEGQSLAHLFAANTAQLSEDVLTDTLLPAASAGVLDVIAAQPGASVAAMARELPTSAQGSGDADVRSQAFEAQLVGALGRRNHDQLVQQVRRARPIVAKLASERRQRELKPGRAFAPSPPGRR